jgi:hypothetical protein
MRGTSGGKARRSRARRRSPVSSAAAMNRESGMEGDETVCG